MLVEVYGRLLWTGIDQTGTAGENAKQVLNKIAATNPNSTQYYYAKGHYLYTVERDYEGALAEYQKVLLENPNDAELLLNIASCYKRLHRFNESIPVINKAQRLDPDNPSLHFESVTHRIARGELKQAMALAQVGRDRFPENASGISHVGYIHIDLYGDVNKAIEVWESLSLEDKQQFAPLYFELKATAQNLESIINNLNSIKNDNPWRSLGIDYQVMQLRLSFGQQAQAQELAINMLAFVEQWLASGKPLTGNKPKASYAFFSNMACVAKDESLIKKYVHLMNDTDAKEIISLTISELNYGLALAECGDTEAGWNLIMSNLEKSNLFISEWELAVRPIYSHYFSEVPEYQAKVNKLLNTTNQ